MPERVADSPRRSRGGLTRSLSWGRRGSRRDSSPDLTTTRKVSINSREGRVGISLCNRKKGPGVIVSGCQRGSLSAEKLHVGDVIFSVNNIPVNSHEAAIREVDVASGGPSGMIELLIWGDKPARSVVISKAGPAGITVSDHTQGPGVQVWPAPSPPPNPLCGSHQRLRCGTVWVRTVRLAILPERKSARTPQVREPAACCTANHECPLLARLHFALSA